jgi:Ca2+-binding EF-hand superfamily protein
MALPYLLARGEEASTSPGAATSVAVSEPGGACVVELNASIDGASFDAYWDKAFDAIFAFADCNDDGILSDQEIRLAPSARALSLALGNGFAPPVAPLRSVKDVLRDSSQECTKDALKHYYRENQAGGVQVGCGQMTQTAALTDAFVQQLDEDKDGMLSKAELISAENSLKKLDTNDDELICAGELLPNCIYPGCAGVNDVVESSVVELSGNADSRLLLARLPREVENQTALLDKIQERMQANHPSAETLPIDKTTWSISLSNQINGVPLTLEPGKRLRCEAWSVAGPSTERYQQLHEQLIEIETVQPKPPSADGAAGRREADFTWLIPLVDRNQDGEASSDEIHGWLELQKQLSRGQLLVSIIYGGGLFEMLDVNHDGGLSIRELRNAWRVLESASCTSGDKFDRGKAPAVVLMIASQGYPASFAQVTTTDIEWFQTMDRNRDGDVSRREFTGSIEIFSKLDQNRDALISPEEAQQVGKQ